MSPRTTVALAAQQSTGNLHHGLTWHMEVVGNFAPTSTALARRENPTVNTHYPGASLSCRTPRTELVEEELPMVRLMAAAREGSRGWGKYRGGLGYEQMVAYRGKVHGLPTATGSSFTPARTVWILLNSLPLCKVKASTRRMAQRSDAKIFSYDTCG
jgi:hypothetical protein